MSKYQVGDEAFTVYNTPIKVTKVLPDTIPQKYLIYNNRISSEQEVLEAEITYHPMQKLGTCKYAVNDRVSWKPVSSNPKSETFQPFIITEVLSNSKGEYEDKSGIENYWIKDNKGNKYKASSNELSYFE